MSGVFGEIEHMSSLHILKLDGQNVLAFDVNIAVTAKRTPLGRRPSTLQAAAPELEPHRTSCLDHGLSTARPQGVLGSMARRPFQLFFAP